MDHDIGHPMSSAWVCSRREPPKIAQGKHSAALGKRQRESHPPWKGGSNTGATDCGIQGRCWAFTPPRRGGNPSAERFPRVFTLGYFRLLPPGGTALDASLLPHLELLVMEEATAIYAAAGLTLSDAFRMLLMRTVAERALPFDPLTPNAETVEAMKAARRGELVEIGSVENLLADLRKGD